MTNATRQALERVDQILHEAGWDQSPAEEQHPAFTDVTRFREAYESLLGPQHFEMLAAVLRQGLTVEEAGKTMGLPEGEARALFREARKRLREFVEAAEGGANGSGSELPSGNPVQAS